MKRFLSVLLAVCMLLAMAPFAFAVTPELPFDPGEDTYSYMGEYLPSDSFGDGPTDKCVWGSQGTTGYWKWHGPSATMTLHNIEISGISLGSVADDVTLVLEGENKINCTEPTAVSLRHNVTIKGSGSLEIDVTNADACAIKSSGCILLNGAKLRINARGIEEVVGIKAYAVELVNGTELQFDIKTEEYGTYIYTDNTLSVKNSRIIGNMKRTEMGDYSFLNCFNIGEELLIDNSIVKLRAENTVGNIYGVYSESDVEICNGSAVELELVSGAAGTCYAIRGDNVSLSEAYIDVKGGTVTGRDAEDNYLELTDCLILTPGLKLLEKDELIPEDRIANEYGYPATEMLIVPRAYNDVAFEQWFTPAVGFATARGLFKGVDADNFAPFMQLTRAQMMTILARMSGANVDPAPGEIWYEKAVEWAVENGVSDGTDPNGKITREQMITMVWRYLGEPEGDGDLTQFTDRNKIDGWAEDALAWAVEYGVISGRGEGILDPDGTANRAEAAQLLKNFLINY